MENILKNYIKSAVAALALVGMTVAGVAADSKSNSEGFKVGTLTCHFDTSVGWLIGSVKEADCLYKGINGEEQLYTAELSRLGVDVGVTGAQTVVWAVIAPGKAQPDSLEGTYLGASAEATAIVGLNANALLGGFKKSIALQPVSIGAQTGVNVAAGIGSLRLRAE
jgi:hypothetical protein